MISTWSFKRFPDRLTDDLKNWNRIKWLSRPRLSNRGYFSTLSNTDRTIHGWNRSRFGWRKATNFGDESSNVNTHPSHRACGCFRISNQRPTIIRGLCFIVVVWLSTLSVVIFGSSTSCYCWPRVGLLLLYVSLISALEQRGRAVV